VVVAAAAVLFAFRFSQVIGDSGKRFSRKRERAKSGGVFH
jgi:hypothetical protein